MVMRGGGRNREIQRLQGAAAANGGEGTARQQARMQYLQNHQQAGRRPQGPQTGGPLQEAMGAAGQAAMQQVGGAVAGSGNDLRFQQPYQGGGSNGGVTSTGGLRTMDGSRVGPDGRMIMPTAQELEQSAQENGRRMGMTPDQFNQWRETANNNGIRSAQQNDPGFARPGMAPPMQRPTPGQNDMGFNQPYKMDPAQMERMKLGMQAPRTMGQNPNTIAGQGVGAGRFQTDGMRAPEARNPTGNQFMGGGDPNMNRFSKFGSFVPPARNVEGNQVRGGGSPGLSRRRVDTNRGPATGVLAPPPNRMR